MTSVVSQVCVVVVVGRHIYPERWRIDSTQTQVEQMATRFLVGNCRAYHVPTTPAIIAIRTPFRSHHSLLLFKKSPLCQTRRQSGFQSSPLSTTTTTRPKREMTTFYDLKAEKPNGTTLNFSELKGKVVLIVNVASQWYVESSVS